MGDEEKNNDNQDALSSDADNEDMEDITWEDAAADLEKQQEMLKEAASGETEVAAESGEMPAAPTESGISTVMPENFSRILDIPLPVTVELGHTKMLINDLLQLGQGSVIELTKLVGEPLEIKVNEKLIARGEVVVVNEKFGIRLSEIISTKDRIESMG